MARWGSLAAVRFGALWLVPSHTGGTSFREAQPTPQDISYTQHTAGVAESAHIPTTTLPRRSQDAISAHLLQCDTLVLHVAVVGMLDAPNAMYGGGDVRKIHALWPADVGTF